MISPETLDAVVARIHIPIGGIVPMLVILVVIVIVWVIVQAASSGNKAKPPMGVGASGVAPFCNTCGTMGHWVAQYQLWGCAKCQNYIGTTPAAPAPPVAAAAPFCNTCGTPGRWIAESNSFGCDRCRILITKQA